MFNTEQKRVFNEMERRLFALCQRCLVPFVLLVLPMNFFFSFLFSCFLLLRFMFLLYAIVVWSHLYSWCCQWTDFLFLWLSSDSSYSCSHLSNFLFIIISIQQTYFSCEGHSFYLSLAALAALAHLFQAGVQFSTGKARETALSEVHKYQISLISIPNTTFPIANYLLTNAVLSQDNFSTNLRTFLRTFSRP